MQKCISKKVIKLKANKVCIEFEVRNRKKYCRKLTFGISKTLLLAAAVTINNMTNSFEFSLRSMDWFPVKK